MALDARGGIGGPPMIVDPGPLAARLLGRRWLIRLDPRGRVGRPWGGQIGGRKLVLELGQVGAEAGELLLGLR